MAGNLLLVAAVLTSLVTIGNTAALKSRNEVAPIRCPAIDNPEEAIQLPNPNDCHSFYKCDASGVAWLTPCPAGLEYNAKLGVCDYAENAGCSIPASDAPAEEPAEEPSTDVPSEGGDDAAADDKPQPPPAPACPDIENPDEAIQLANPSDCHSFYKCDASGVAWLTPCPAGLEYNTKLGVCDYPENAGCSIPSPSDDEEQEAEQDEAGAVNDGEVVEVKPVPVPEDAPACPDIDDPEEAIQLPNPSDCSSFYKCDASGVAWLIPCPAGLEYNKELNVCDYPQSSGCQPIIPVKETARLKAL